MAGGARRRAPPGSMAKDSAWMTRVMCLRPPCSPGPAALSAMHRALPPACSGRCAPAVWRPVPRWGPRAAHLPVLHGHLDRLYRAALQHLHGALPPRRSSQGRPTACAEPALAEHTRGRLACPGTTSERDA